MTELVFPEGFLWGVATAAHQVEGGNTNSDWWDWEARSDTRTREPSGAAIEHYTRFPADIKLIAGLGFNTYRFSLEWARIEPEEGAFDEAALDHYRAMVAATRKAGLEPLVTIHHFTLPRWVAAQGGWLSDRTPVLFERYTRKVVETLGDRVTWYVTINEPGVVAFGGILAALNFPPGVGGVANWRRSIALLIEAHRRARSVIRELRPGAKVGIAHSMQEWESNWGGRPVIDYARELNEDVFLRACADDDYIGVNTYTRQAIEFPRIFGALARVALAIGPLERRLVPRVVAQVRDAADSQAFGNQPGRRTQMGYEWRPSAIAACVRRVAGLYPGKPILVTEHGVATADDEERIEFIRDGLAALHGVLADGIPLRGYVHWSAFDNFEWALGYGMLFGLIGVDRATQKRTVKPSARYLGEIAKSNRLDLAE